MHRSPLSWMVSLLLTAVAGAVLGAASAWPGAPAPPQDPVVGAQIRMAGPARAGAEADLLVSLTNYGPGDAVAPLDSMLSLEVLRLDSPGGVPLSMVATTLGIPAAGPATLAPGESAHVVVPLARLGVLDEPGLYRLRGDVAGPAGLQFVGPIEVRVLPPPAIAATR